MVEVRFKGFDAMQWYGSVGPASLQPDVAKQLNESQVAVLKTSDQRHKLLGEAFEPWPMSPEQFGKFIRSEITRWAALAKARNIQLEECPGPAPTSCQLNISASTRQRPRQAVPRFLVIPAVP